MEIPREAPLVYISFSAEINQMTTEALIASLILCANLNVKAVHILFSCSGGNVVNGFNLYNMLAGMPYDTIMHNVGQVDSIGTLIFLGAKKRYATPNSTFMFHGIGYSIQNQRLEEKDFKEKLEDVLRLQKKLGAEYVKHTSLTAEDAVHFFSTAEAIDASSALAKGIIHEIKDVSLIPGCPIIPHVFQRK